MYMYIYIVLWYINSAAENSAEGGAGSWGWRASKSYSSFSIDRLIIIIQLYTLYMEEGHNTRVYIRIYIRIYECVLCLFVIMLHDLKIRAVEHHTALWTVFFQTKLYKYMYTYKHSCVCIYVYEHIYMHAYTYAHIYV